MDQFTFGDKVESKDALSLPVQLAVSLLKDRDGRINLDVPVSGSLTLDLRYLYRQNAPSRPRTRPSSTSSPSVTRWRARTR
ncbi:DUF748 domain-containing protein [Mycobacterium tuberculosis]|uniref:DUF748 domain-containing protein n=1 Tax=Mycobacterium tuberculosis TaxID=1773 RepID=UPI00350F67C8